MHGFANPKRFLSLAAWLTPALLVCGLLTSAAALYWGLFQVPPDRLMGETVRILFLHVPAAWLGMGGWMAIALSSLAFLVWRHPLAALAARAAALPGLASGLRLAAVYAPIGAIIGEWVGASRGLGYLMLLANGRAKIDLMFAALLVLAVFTLLLHRAVDAACRHWLDARAG